MSLSKAQTAIEGAAITALGSIPIEYENSPFTKPTNSKWAQMYFIPASSVIDTVGSGGQNIDEGILQINLNYPVSTGASAAVSDYETLRTALGSGKSFTSSGQTIRSKYCERSGGRLVDNWYRVSITVGWYTQITR